MSEQIDLVSTAPRLPTQRIALPLSDAVRASLQAVREAQEAAQRRARRETRTARLWFGGIVATIVAGLLAFGPRGRGHHADPSTPVGPTSAAAATWPSAAQASARIPGSGLVAPAASTLPSSDAVGLGAAGATAASTSPPAPLAATRREGDLAIASAADGACTASFGQRRWRLSIDTCTRAFEARPTDSRLALKIAQAQHARARLPEAAVWANRAIGLDPGLPEAFVIVAHAETQAGHPVAAAEAYRRYLALAPRGWHAGEARAALRVHARAERARLRVRTPLSTAGASTVVPVAAAE